MRKVKPETIKQLLARPGVRVEVGEPFPFRNDGGFMCLAKFVVPRFPVMQLYTDPPTADLDSTATMCIVSGQGNTPEEARHNLMERLGEARQLPSLAPTRPRRGWLGRLIKAFG